MSREDIIRMAREAELKSGQHWNAGNMDTEHMQSFAALVAAAEREACAKTVERARLQLDGRHGITNETDFIATRIVDFLAAQIRERKA